MSLLQNDIPATVPHQPIYVTAEEKERVRVDPLVVLARGLLGRCGMTPAEVERASTLVVRSAGLPDPYLPTSKGLSEHRG